MPSVQACAPVMDSAVQTMFASGESQKITDDKLSTYDIAAERWSAKWSWVDGPHHVWGRDRGILRVS